MSLWASRAARPRRRARAAHARGVQVYGMLYGADDEASLPGSWLRHGYQDIVVETRMRGRMLTLVADREEVVVAHLPSDADAVVGVRTRSPALVLLAQEYLHHDRVLQAAQQKVGFEEWDRWWQADADLREIISGEPLARLPPLAPRPRRIPTRRRSEAWQRHGSTRAPRGDAAAAGGVRPLILAGDRLLTGAGARRHLPVRRPRGRPRRAGRRGDRRARAGRRRRGPRARSRRCRRSAAPRSSTAPPTSSPSASRSWPSQMTLETGNAIWETRMEVRRTVEILRGAAEESRRITGEQIPIDAWPNGEGRYAMTRRFPVGPGARHHAVQRAAAAGRAQARARARRRLPLHHPAGHEDAAVGALAGRDRGRGRRAARARSASSPARPRWARRWRGTSASRPSPSPAAARSAGTCAASPRTHRITLELGGNGAVIVHEDANVAYAAKRVRLRRLPALRAGLHLGAAPVRARVDRRRVRGALVGEIEGMALGDPSDDATIVGCLVNERAADAAMAVIEEARAAGARVAVRRHAASARRASRRRCSPTCRRPPGPAPARSSRPSWPSPRTTTWTTRSPPPAKRFTACRRASSRMICESSSVPIQQLEVGGVIVNDVNTYRVDHMPYGGERRSGAGREGVRFAIRDFTQERLLVVDPR